MAEPTKIRALNTLDAIRHTFLPHHPFKALWALVAISSALIRLPIWSLLWLFPRFRQSPHWTFRQALGVRLLRLLLFHSSLTEVKTPISLSPGSEKARFVVIDPNDKKLSGVFTGVLEADKSVKPLKVGATWFPEAPTPQGDKEGDTVLHFHGGAFVLGDGRTQDAGFAAKTFLDKKGAGVSRVLTPQYRLSSNPGCRFPAALQDAVASYAYLVIGLGIRTSKIVVSGDSAGGNLVIALLRYLAEHGEQVGLGSPGAAWLWSPWVNPGAARDTRAMTENPRYGTDYLTPGFGYWGAWSYAPDQPKCCVEISDPYIKALGNPFKTSTAVWVQTGSDEVLFEDDVRFAEEMTSAGNTVETDIVENSPHDIILIGHLLGWKEEARLAARRAGEFLRRERFVG
ncbi:MAG: hypothetical protein M1820_008121 [Bogoriella megaspora]|nr:MAG: hypothetical protein M1820_008121 [Bogoriella megaspora]